MQKQQPRAGARRNMVEGGKVRGPGTGTSDSVPSKVRPGSYVVPADTTKSVNLSNGEQVLNPAQVHAVGVAALDALRGATHQQVPKGARRTVPAGDGDGDTPANDPDADGMRNGGKVKAGAKCKPGMANGGAVTPLDRVHKPFGAGSGPGRKMMPGRGTGPVPVAAAPAASVPGMADGGVVKYTPAELKEINDAGNQMADLRDRSPYESGADPALTQASDQIYPGVRNTYIGNAVEESVQAGRGKVNPPMARGARRNYADGGAVPMSDDDRQKLIAQIPTDTPPPNLASRPDGNVNQSEFSRNVQNTANALPGVGGLLTGGAAILAGASKAAPAIAGALGLGARVVPKVMPYAVPAAGAAIIKQGMADERAAATPATAPAPAAAPIAPNPADQRLAGNTAASPADAPAVATAAAQPTVEQSGNTQSADNIATMNRAGQYLREMVASQTPATPFVAPIVPDRAAEQNAATDEAYYRGKADDAIRLMPGARGARAAQVYASMASGMADNRARADNLQTQEQGQNTRAGITDTGQTARNTASIASNERVAGDKNALAAAEAAPAIGINKQKLVDARQLSALHQQYMQATDEATRRTLGEQILTLSGKDHNNRFTVVPGGQSVDPTTGMVVREPSAVLNNDNGQFVQQPGAAGARTGAPQPQAISMLKANPALAAKFDEKYGPGAAARALGQK